MPPRVLASGPKPCGGNKVMNDDNNDDNDDDDNGDEPVLLSQMIETDCPDLRAVLPRGCSRLKLEIKLDPGGHTQPSTMREPKSFWKLVAPIRLMNLRGPLFLLLS